MLNKLKRAALGAHTPHDKATAASKPVPMPLPAQVRILMSQHIGAPAKALVKKGDEVFVGTKIGEAGGFVSANIHSSVSGTVAAVEPFRLSNGRMCDSVVIKTDGKQTVDPAVKAPEVTDKAIIHVKLKGCSSLSGSPGWHSSWLKSMLRRCTRAGVPVLNRRSGRPAAFRLSVRALAACMPSGPDAYHASPTKILPPRFVPVAMTTHFALYSPFSWVTTPFTWPFSTSMPTTSA